MKKFLNILVLLILTAMPVFSDTLTYSSVPIKDEKTGLEFARAIVSENFNVESNVTWTRDFENPARLFVSAKSNVSDVEFSYLSGKSYVDNLKLVEMKNGELDYDFRTTNKKMTSPEEYLKEIILSKYPNATDITTVSSVNMPNGMSEYLMGLMYQRIDELNLTAKADSRYSKIKITNPEIIPCIMTFSYKLNEKTYDEMFLTMFTSVEYQFTGKNKNDKNKIKDKKFWKMNGLYSYKAESKDFEKNFEDFVMFVANSMPNNKAVSALEHVKQEMLIELNPYFVDYNKKSSLKNRPSELFKRYFEVGLPDYSYISSMIKPTLSQVRWLINVVEPQAEFSYRKINQVWRQKIYVPQKYKYVYLQKSDKKLMLSTEFQKPEKGWIVLKADELK